MHIKAEEIGKIIEEQIRNYDQHVEMSETGTVMYVGDGIARVYGVRNAMSMELLEFPGGLMGMVLNLEEDNVGVALLGDDTGIKEGDPARCGALQGAGQADEEVPRCGSAPTESH